MWSPKLYAQYHRNCICGHGYQLPLISIRLQFESKNRNRRPCYTNSAEGTIHGSIGSLLQYSCMMPKKLDSGGTLCTVFSDGKQSCEPCPIVLFLFRLDTNSYHAHGQQYQVQRSLQLQHSTIEWHIKIILPCPTYSLQPHSLGYDKDIVAEHGVEK